VTKPSKAKTSIAGAIANLEAGAGFLYAEGWFKGTVEPREELALIARSDGVEIGRVRISGPIKDSAATQAFYIAFATSGKPGGTVSLALLIGGAETPLPPFDLKPKPFKPRGRIDVVDASSVHGWLFDPSSRVEKRKPFLLIDNLHVVELDPDLQRDDVSFRDDLAGGAGVGFSLSLRDMVRRVRGGDSKFAAADDAEHTAALMSADSEIACITFRLGADVIGKLERCDQAQAAGWAAVKGKPDLIASVELFIDGVRYHSVRAGYPRSSLIAKGVVKAGGGFRFDLPWKAPGDDSGFTLSVKPAYSKEEIEGGPLGLERPTHRHRDWKGVLGNLQRSESLRVTIIIPIYNAPEEVAACIESVVLNTTVPARLLLIDDASPDPKIGKILARWKKWPNVDVHRNPENLGYTRTINKGIRLSGNDDVVFLNSDTIVSPGWLEGLRIAAHSDEAIGTATPVSNNAGAFSVPEFGVGNVLPAWWEAEDFGRMVRQAALPLMPLVPTGNGFCMYVRRACLDAVGSLDEQAFPRGYGEENDFCMRAGRAGFLHVVDDRTFVFHKRSASFGQEKRALYEAGRGINDQRYPEYSYLTSAFAEDTNFLTMRWRVRRALERARANGATPRPRVLYVISTSTGGTPQTNRDLMEALSDRYEPWVLRCDSLMLELSSYSAAGDQVVETVQLDQPVVPSLHRSVGYDRAVADILVRYGFELVHVRHIAWHGLGLTAICRRLGLPVVFSFHDFYTVCPTIKLLDENLTFCGGKCTASPGPCKAELWPTSRMPPLKHAFVYRWRELMSQALSECDAFVTTSVTARETILGSYPAIARKDFRVIPHGRSFEEMSVLAATPKTREPLRVLIPGNISKAKGADLVTAVAELDVDGKIELHILGDAGRLVARRNIVLHGVYQRADFAAHVKKIQPHLGAVLSIWPETYCHTLTELWSCGLPVVAFDLGAVGERIRKHGAGWLMKRGATAETLFSLLIKLKKDRHAVSAGISKVRSWQEQHGQHYDTKAMAVEYDVLYREILARRRAFSNPEKEEYRLPKTVLVLSDRNGAAGEAIAPTHNRLTERTRNRTSRPVIFREVSPALDLRDSNLGRRDAVLLRQNTIKPAAVRELIEKCRSAKLPIILDLDEIPGVPGKKHDPKDRAIGATARSLVESAAMIFVPTVALKERLDFAAKLVKVMPAMLDARQWASIVSPVTPLPEATLERRSRGSRILCMGTHVDDDDLEIVRPAIEALVRAHVCELHVIGGKFASAHWFKHLPIPDAAQDSSTFAPWFRLMALSYDFAIAPRRDTSSKAGKSDLIFLEYSGAGLASIVSNIATFATLSDAALVVENTAAAWQQAIAKLAMDVETRARLARCALRRVSATRMIKTGAEGFDDALLGMLANNPPGDILDHGQSSTNRNGAATAAVDVRRKTPRVSKLKRLVRI
jgi:GT2 family glycosyltransferase